MGDTPPPVNEESSPRKISPYGASKLACEGYITAYSKCFNIKSIIPVTSLFSIPSFGAKT